MIESEYNALPFSWPARVTEGSKVRRQMQRLGQLHMGSISRRFLCEMNSFMMLLAILRLPNST